MGPGIEWALTLLAFEDFVAPATPPFSDHPPQKQRPALCEPAQNQFRSDPHIRGTSHFAVQSCPFLRQPSLILGDEEAEPSVRLTWSPELTLLSLPVALTALPRFWAGTETGMWHPEQHCPTEPSVMMETFYICAVQHSSHQPYVAVAHLKCG